MRWTFDLADNSNTIKREPIDDLAGEFPRFDERRAGLAYRHGWFAGITRERRGLDPLRHDLAHRPDDRQARRPRASRPATRPASRCSCRASPDAAEGDGWLVAVVYRGTEDRSDFVVFDAQDVAAGPIATAKVPRRVPFGFHGNWRAA